MRPRICYPTWDSDEVADDGVDRRESSRQFRRSRSHRSLRRRSTGSTESRPSVGIAGRRRRRFSW